MANRPLMSTTIAVRVPLMWLLVRLRHVVRAITAVVTRDLALMIRINLGGVRPAPMATIRLAIPTPMLAQRSETAMWSGAVVTIPTKTPIRMPRMAAVRAAAPALLHRPIRIRTAIAMAAVRAAPAV
jgi:hypothetical protein